jgi:ABC-type transport system involved in multi-copper enzyme maturation permease subunit
MNKILTIAQLTVKGELRNKVIYILMAMAFLFFFMARGCTPGKINIEKGFLSADQITNIGMIFTFNCIIFWGLSLCGLLAMSALPRELTEETIILTITKPIKRSWFLMGKFLGMLFIVFINLIVLTIGFLFFFYLRTGTFTLSIFPSLAVIFLNFILIISMIFLLSLLLPRAISALLTLIIYATSLGLSIPFFFEKVRGYWEPSPTAHVLHYLLPQFGGLHLYALSFQSDFFPSSMGLWSVIDITGYVLFIWLVMFFVFQRKAL